MSEADAYYKSLIQQGYPPYEALPYTQQYFPQFTDPQMAAPAPPQQQVVFAPVLTGLPSGQGHALPASEHEATTMGWVSLGLFITAMIVAIYAFNSPAWLSGEITEEGEDVTLDMGLSKMQVGLKGFGIPIPYNSFFCEYNWCEEADSAGTAGQAGLGIGILALGGAAFMTFKKQNGPVGAPFGMMAGFVGSAAIIIGALAWYSMFPDTDTLVMEFLDLEMSLGSAFFAAIGSGVLGIAGSITSMMD